MKLTKKERIVYEYMLAFQAEQAQYPVGPTARQIVKACDLSGPAHAHQIWESLEAKGLLKRAPNRRVHGRYAIVPETPLDNPTTEQ